MRFHEHIPSHRFIYLLHLDMKILLIIGFGSFIGGIVRHLLTQCIHARSLSAFPYGTLTVNIIGCLFIGVIFGISERTGVSDEWRLFMTAGLLGGFTTFSAFSHQSMVMLREGQFAYAGLYIAASVLLGIMATFAGFSIIKYVL